MKLILALVDFSEVTSDLVTLAGKLARGTGSRLVLLHVAMPEAELVGGEVRADASREGIAGGLRRRHRDLEILQMELGKLGVDALALMVRSDSARGNPAPKIIDEVHRLEPDLILMGTNGAGRLRQLLIGSVSDTVMRKVHRPVLLVPSPGS